MKNCKECIYSKVVHPKNPECVPEAVCTLSDEEFHDCLFNDKSRFEENKVTPEAKFVDVDMQMRIIKGDLQYLSEKVDKLSSLLDEQKVKK